jgi:hypothetical protein
VQQACILVVFYFLFFGIVSFRAMLIVRTEIYVYVFEGCQFTSDLFHIVYELYERDIYSLSINELDVRWRTCSVSVQVSSPDTGPPDSILSHPSCPRWKLTAYPTLNDGSAFLLRNLAGEVIPDGVKDVTIVRIYYFRFRLLD